MLKEPLPPVREKLNGSYVSSCSEDETSSPDSSHHTDANSTEAETEAEVEPAIDANTHPNEKENEIENANSNAGMYIASTASAESHDTNDVLHSRISSLEEQLQSLALAFQIIQNEQSRASNNQTPPPCDRLSLSNWKNDPMLESESPPPADKDLSEILSVRCSEEELAPAPGLEYRSFTPTYEEELRKIRKTSRGLSLDQSDTSSVHGHAMKGSGSSGSVLHLGLDKEEKKEDINIMHNAEKADVNGNENGSIHGRSSIQNDILAEGKDDKSVHKNKQGKPPIKPSHESPSSSSGLPPKSPSRINLASMTASISQSSKIETESAPAIITTATTTYSQLEEKMNTNAVLDFIRGLNIDSRQQDGSATEDVDVNMEEFLRVPFHIEKLLLFGLAVCFDCFLYVLTVTPLKFVWSLLCLVCTIVRPGKGIGFCRFHRRHLYQLLRVFVIWFTYQYVLCPISLGRLYHWIRGQAMLKLYVLMAMVEVFDRLMCSFGQDALDSLYWNTTRRPYHPRMIASTVVVLVYAIIHSLILFVHAATLNVAMNSADSALMSLLIGGNFAEIKSTVFKKYNKQNLFKITTSDICERFKLVLFLGLVLLLNCTQGGMNQEMVNDYINMSLIILGAEMVCDWIKHSFITKFNFIKSSVYLDYSLVMAGDLTGIGHEASHIEQTHAVVKRLGFAQIPLICVMLRYLREAARYAVTLTHDGDSNHVLYSFAETWTNGSYREISGYMLSFYLCLLGLKFLLGYAITRKARSIILYGPLGQHESDPSPQRRQAV